MTAHDFPHVRAQRNCTVCGKAKRVGERLCDDCEQWYADKPSASASVNAQLSSAEKFLARPMTAQEYATAGDCASCGAPAEAECSPECRGEQRWAR